MTVKRRIQNLLHQIRGVRGALSAMHDHRHGRSIKHKDWEKILWAHCATNGRFTDWLTPILRRINPHRTPADASGLLGHFTIADQQRIAGQIARDGYYVFDELMPEHICDNIEKFARSTPAYRADEFGQSDKARLYDPKQPDARVYKLREGDCVTDPAVQAIMADDALLRIVETYFQTAAVVGGIDTWWSAPYGNGPGSQAAQLFHFDFDAPPRWLKFFVYVTPVGSENGPHVFVKGSHKAQMPNAREILSRGYERIPDVDIAAAYGKEAAVEITGPRGTVFLADTRGFHKGKHPTGGDRLICQLMYCSPVFNNHAPRPYRPKSFSSDLATAIKKNPAAYQRYL